jgi:predicted metal-dependent hydrolase
MSAVVRPADLVITPRNLAFGRGQAQARWWFGGDPVATTLFNALSLTFPKGEAFFIESVRHYRDAASEPLAGQIAAFIRQEAVHSREHVHFNSQVREAGYDLSELEARLEAEIAFARDRPPLVQLTATLCLEHFTAILAHAWLSNPRDFRGAPPEIARLWRWHALEEIEHKGVAFDTFLAASRNLRPLQRWILRSHIMLLVTRRFLTFRRRDMAQLFAQDGVNTAATWLATTRYLFVYPGILRRILPAWLAFFAPGFHPWRHDDRALLRRVEAELAAVEQV